MLGEAQDVLLAAETSLSRHRRNRRRSSGRRPTEEAPHCLTCCCLDNRQVACGQGCSNSARRRHSARRNTTVDELLREMSFNAASSDVETYANGKNEVEDASEESPRPRSRRDSVGYCEVAGKSPETTTARSCERWSHLDVDVASQIRSVKSGTVVERHSERKWPPPTSDRKNSRRLQQQLHGAGDRNVQPEEPTKVTDVDEEESSSETLAEEAHVRELKLKRWQFIERIHDEVTKLHRLQRHLDGCCSPPTTLARRRSVSTMTSARRLHATTTAAEGDGSGQL